VPALVARIDPVLTRLDAALSHQFPHHMVEKLLKIFQTSSCDEFNAIFANIQLEIKTKSKTLWSKSSTPAEDHANLKDLLKLTGFAVAQYTEIQQGKNGWPYIGEQGSVYPTATGDNANLIAEYKGEIILDGSCWNCGKHGHQMRQCRAPINRARCQAHAEANKKKRAGRQPPKAKDTPADSPDVSDKSKTQIVIPVRPSR